MGIPWEQEVVKESVIAISSVKFILFFFQSLTFIWFQCFYVTSSTSIYISNIKTKFAYTCVTCNFKRIFPTSSLECFDFITPQFMQFYLNKPMIVFCQSLSYCAFLHTGMQQHSTVFS